MTAENRDKIDYIAEKVDGISRRVEEMHRWLLGNGKIGLFEKIRRLSLYVKIIGLGMALLILEAAFSGKIASLAALGLELLK